MSTAGIFKLITNDGKQDRMLMATQLLNTRLQQIQRMRAKNGARDPTPTLVDIERTHILFMNAHFKPFAAIGYEYNKVQPQSGTALFGSTIQFSIPQFGDFFNDMVFHCKISGTNAVNNAQATNNLNGKFRYAELLGHKLLKKVTFDVNGNHLDEYTSDVMNTHFAFYVSKDKEVGYKRGIGQQVPIPAIVNDPFSDTAFQYSLLDGPQTPKTTHDEIDLWIPLLFWFNTDPRLSIPSVSIPYGQRFITLELETLDRLTSGDAFVDPIITDASLYINNIFVNPEIHDIFIKRIGFNLIRVHRTQRQVIEAGHDEILLSNLKWPITVMYVCFKPSENEDSIENWHRCGLIDEREACVAASQPAPTPPGSTFKQLVSRGADYKKCIRPVSTLGVSAHGIPIYNSATPSSFYNTYIPYTYGPEKIRTPDDCGAFMIPFCLYPGSYQPSGHINISRAREFYLNYTSATVPAGFVGARTPGDDIISADNPAIMVVVAIAINFLLISDGSAVLRYST